MSSQWQNDLKVGFRRTINRTFLIVVCAGVLGAVFHAKLGGLSAAIYAEAKFEEVRYGPHRTVEDIDGTLSWFKRKEVPRAFVMRPLYLGADVMPILKRDDVQFVSYYIGQSGFVVVYDMDGKKLTQIKTDV